MDATRISDNAMVSLKRMEDGLENEIASYFSTEPLASHPHNHCVPVYEVLRVPDLDNVVIVVMPQLRPFNKPRFKSVGESVEFFRQIFEVSEIVFRASPLVPTPHNVAALVVAYIYSYALPVPRIQSWAAADVEGSVHARLHGWQPFPVPASGGRIGKARKPVELSEPAHQG